MSVPIKYVLQQGPVLRGMGGAVLAALKQRAGFGGHRPAQVPGPEHRLTVAPRSTELVQAYLRNVGGDPSSYKGRVPAHLFPQWAFPLTGKLVEGVTERSVALDGRDVVKSERHLASHLKVETVLWTRS